MYKGNYQPGRNMFLQHNKKRKIEERNWIIAELKNFYQIGYGGTVEEWQAFCSKVESPLLYFFPPSRLSGT
jgi:hypothetical protein